MAKPSSPARRKPRFRERNTVLPRPAPVPQQPKPSPPRVAPPRRRAEHRVIPLPRLTVEGALYLGILGISFGLRIWDAGSRPMHGDESVHAWLAWNLFKGIGYAYDPVYHGPLQFPVTALFYFLFGPSNTAGRLMAILFGTALVGLPFFLRQYLGRVAALLSAVLIAVSPAFVYVSRLERDDIFTSFFALTMALGMLGYVRTRQPRFLYLLFASAALSLAAMENTYITYFIFGSFAAIVMATEVASRRRVGERLRKLWARTGSEHLLRMPVVLGAFGAVLLAFVLTVLTGLYLPVPLVLGALAVLLVHRQALLELQPSGESSYLDPVRGTSRMVWLSAATIVVGVLFLAYSTFGTNLHGIWDSSQPFLNTSSACPGNSFPLNPCRKDITGGLFYWLSQHKVARGGQPWYYYTLLYGLYEQIAVVFGVAGVVWFWRRPTLFTAFLTYWAIWAFGIYSWAGEKFPWLMIHPLLPFMLLAALFVVDVLWRAARVRYLLLAVLGLLALIELHGMYEVNYVHAADPVEMMVYVQSSPDTPRVADQILSLSNKVTNGPNLHVTIDADETWPFAWYLRDMPNVAYPSGSELTSKPYVNNPVIIVDEANQPLVAAHLARGYTVHRYRLRWWFPEEGYKALTWPSLRNKLLDPGYWRVIEQWFANRRPFGPKGAVWFYLYVKKGLASPY